jgi:hypothetical protein
VKQVRVPPRRLQFPTALPLTPEERALIGIAASSPELLSNYGQPAGPLAIPDLQIQPLEIHDLG